MPRSCSNWLVSSESLPAAIRAGLAGGKVFSASPTASTSFCKYESLSSFSLIAFPLSSSPWYKPSKNPVAAVRFDTMSCTNRNGGFPRSLSLSFGLLIWGESTSLVNSKLPSAPKASGGVNWDVQPGGIGTTAWGAAARPDGVGVWSSAGGWAAAAAAACASRSLCYLSRSARASASCFSRMARSLASRSAAAWRSRSFCSSAAAAAPSSPAPPCCSL